MARRKIGPDAMAVLQSHDWPGNIRQLRNNVERLMILTAGDPEAHADHADEAGDADDAIWTDDEPVEP